jgi:hypothetical protein
MTMLRMVLPGSLSGMTFSLKPLCRPAQGISGKKGKDHQVKVNIYSTGTRGDGLSTHEDRLARRTSVDVYTS